MKIHDFERFLLFVEPQNHPHMLSRAEEIIWDKIKRFENLFFLKMKNFGRNFINFDLKYSGLLLMQTLSGCIGIPIVTHHLSAKIYAHSGAPRTSQLCPKHIIFRA